MTLPLSKLMEGAQKKGAGDRRLEEAAGRTREVEAREAAVAAREAALPGPEQEAPAAPPADDAAKAKDLAQKIQFGTPEEAEAAILEVMSGAGQTGVDPNEIAQDVAMRVHATMGAQGALDTVAQEYPDVLGDANLTQLATRNYWDIKETAANEGVQLSELQMMRAAALATRNWRNSLDGSPATPENTA